MAEFTTITTQEQLDSIIGERLAREKEKYKDYESLKEQVEKQKDYQELKNQLETANNSISGLNAQLEEQNGKITGFNTEKAELLTKIKGYETNSAKMRIAQEVGLPLELIDRLTGDDEEALKEDAHKLIKFVGASTAPLGDTEPKQGDNKSAYKKLLKGLEGED